MAISAKKILIVEDDVSVAAALGEITSRLGYQVTQVTKPDEVFEILKTESFDFLFSDCLLPQMTGPEMVKKILTDVPAFKSKVVLMSGIYTDKAFIKEATSVSKAVAFLHKPFEMVQIQQLVPKVDETDDEISTISTLPQQKSLYDSFAPGSAGLKEKMYVLSQLEEINGMDLPSVYSILSEAKASGYLNIYRADGSVFGVIYSQGQIVGVDTNEKKSMMGDMLINLGFLSRKELDYALTHKGQQKIGAYLIESNMLSPHAFDRILTDQMNIRLAKTVIDEQIKVNFSQSEVELTDPRIDQDDLKQYLHDWIASKVTSSYLNSRYQAYKNRVIEKTSALTSEHTVHHLRLISSMENIEGLLDGNHTLGQFIESSPEGGSSPVRALHFLLILGLIRIKSGQGHISKEQQLSFLKSTWSAISGKNSLEVIKYIEKTSSDGSKNINDKVTEFSVLLGAQPDQANSEALKLWNAIGQVIRQALIDAKDLNALNKMKEDHERLEAQNRLKAAALMEEMKKVLQFGQYAKAVDTLAEVLRLNPGQPQAHVYTAWAKLGAMGHGSNPGKVKEIESHIMQVPPEERYDSLFALINALLLRAKGDPQGAYKGLQKIVERDPHFLPARREISNMQEHAKPKDMLRMDLNDVFSKMFKKK